VPGVRAITDRLEIVVLCIAWVLIFVGMLEWLERRAKRWPR
jgi:hypothetical protein